MKSSKSTFLAATVTLALSAASLHADSFGSGNNTFTIDFVTIGNPGNSNDAGAGGGSYSSPYGGVSYTYRMGVYEITREQIEKAALSGGPAAPFKS